MDGNAATGAPVVYKNHHWKRASILLPPSLSLSSHQSVRKSFGTFCIPPPSLSVDVDVESSRSSYDHHRMLLFYFCVQVDRVRTVAVIDFGLSHSFEQGGGGGQSTFS